MFNCTNKTIPMQTYLQLSAYFSNLKTYFTILSLLPDKINITETNAKTEVLNLFSFLK